MYIILPAIIVNILSIIILSVGIFYNFENPRGKAIYGYFVVGSMLLYIISLCFAVIYGLFMKHNFYSYILILCIISPFIIGKLVKYETLKKYTIAQVACFIVSLAILLLKF